MRIAYLDVFCGLSGDMFLGALVDAGVDLDALVAELRKLPVHGWEVTAERVRKNGLAGTKVHVEEHHHHHHEAEESRGARAAGGAPRSSWGPVGSADTPRLAPGGSRDHHHGMSADDIIAIMRRGTLRADLIERAVGVVEVIAQAEAQAHGVPREQVHFHELGGLDTIIDVCGAVIGLDLLGIEKLYCSPLPVSHGYVDTQHGRLPVPPPAVANLLQGVPTYSLDIEGETVTPTGAAIAVALAEFAERPPMTVTATGLGAGMKDFPIANMVRLFVGDARVSSSAGGSPARAGEAACPTGFLPTHGNMALLEANLDDMSGEFFGYAMDKVFAAGAVDVWATAICMKKNRPAMMLSALAPPDQADAVVEAILMHTTSFGVRRQMVQRDCLDREHVTVETPYGAIRVKVGKRDGKVLTSAPEYDDCAQAADRAGVSLKDVYAAALAAVRVGASDGG